MLAFCRETGESFSSLVTLDLGTLDNYNENQLRERLYRHIAEYRRLGNIEASVDNFNFRSFGGIFADFFHEHSSTYFPFQSFHCV
jgi:hypothetical protein